MLPVYSLKFFILPGNSLLQGKFIITRFETRINQSVEGVEVCSPWEMADDGNGVPQPHLVPDWEALGSSA